MRSSPDRVAPVRTPHARMPRARMPHARMPHARMPRVLAHVLSRHVRMHLGRAPMVSARVRLDRAGLGRPLRAMAARVTPPALPDRLRDRVRVRPAACRALRLARVVAVRRVLVTTRSLLRRAWVSHGLLVPVRTLVPGATHVPVDLVRRPAVPPAARPLVRAVFPGCLGPTRP
jgi:hypothetical protein